MNKFTRLVQKGTQPDGTSLITAQTRTNVSRIVARQVNGALTPYADNKAEYVEKGYQNNDLVYMIIKAIVDKATVAPWALYKIVDDEAYQKSLVLGKQLAEGNYNKDNLHKTNKKIKQYLALREKALKPVADEGFTKLLRRPNKHNTLAKHHATLWSYKLATGDYYERWERAGGGLRAGQPIEWTVLPSQFMSIRTNQKFPVDIIGYTLLAGVMQDFEPDEILHEAYPNLDWAVDGRHLYGLAPLKPMSKRLQRNNESQINGSKLMKNGGQRGIVYIKLPAEALKDDYDGTLATDQTNEMKLRYDEVINSGQPGETAFSGYETGFTPIGLSPVDLDQVNLETHDFRMMCGSFRFPSQLLGDPESKTYNNMAEASKAMILSCVMPLLNDREQSVSAQLADMGKYSDGSYVFAPDMTVYDELSVNRKDQVEYLAKADWLTPNEKRIEMEYDPINTPEMDKIYVSSSLVPIDELAMPPEPAPDGENPDDDEQNPIDYGS